MKSLKLLLGFLFATWSVLALGGCASYRPLRIASVEGGGGVKGTLIEPHFQQVFYRLDRDKTLYFVLKNEGKDASTGAAVEQTIIIRMFWMPRGGRTTMNPTALDATFRYLVMTPKSAALYEGAGFVRIYGTPGAKHLSVRIVDGDLRLAETTADFNDNLGRSRLQGNFSATLSDVQTFDMTEQTHREFFARTLALGGAKTLNETSGPAATQNAATQPGTP